MRDEQCYSFCIIDGLQASLYDAVALCLCDVAPDLEFAFVIEIHNNQPAAPSLYISCSRGHAAVDTSGHVVVCVALSSAKYHTTV